MVRKTAADKPWPLSGIVVLDLGRLIAPAYTTCRLADLGADVIKVELMPDGDYLRNVAPIFGDMSMLHRELGRNKRSIALDWKQPASHQILDRLVAGADVLVESGAPGAADRMGFGSKRLRELNDQLVYCSISAFGESGPYSRLRGHGLSIEAAAGTARVELDSDGAPSLPRMTNFVATQAAGLNAALAITAALFERNVSRRGRTIDTSVWEAAVSFNYQSISCFANLGEDFPYASQTAGFGARYNGYRSRDGLVLVAFAERKFWERFCELVERKDLIGDGAHFSYAIDDVHLAAELQVIMAQRTTEEWVALARNHELPITPVHSASDLLSTDHLRATGMVVQGPADSRTNSTETYVAPPFHYGDEAFEVVRPAPHLGEHTAEVLAEFGFEAGTVDAWQEQHVIMQWK